MDNNIIKQDLIPLSFLAPSIGQALVRKVAGYKGGNNDNIWDIEFNGFKEATVVSILGNILDAVGYDVYKEWTLDKSDKIEKGRVDIGAVNWEGNDTLLCEVKVIWDNDPRLNEIRFYNKFEILKDIEFLNRKKASHQRRIFIIVAFSARSDIEKREENLKTLRLGDVEEIVQEKSEVEAHYFHSDLSQFANTREDCKFLHCIVYSPIS